MSYLFKNIYVDKYNEIKSLKTSFLKFLLLVDIICLYFFFKAIIKYTQDNKTYNATIYKTQDDKFTALDNIYKLKLIITITGSLLLLFNSFIYLLFMSIYKNRSIFTQFSITFFPLMFIFRNIYFIMLCLFIFYIIYSIYLIIKNIEKNKIEVFQDRNDKVQKSKYPYYSIYKFKGLSFAIIFLSLLIPSILFYFIYKAYRKCFETYSYNLDITYTQKRSYKTKFSFIFNCFLNNSLDKLSKIGNKTIEYFVIFFKALLSLILLFLPYIAIMLFFYITIKWFIFCDWNGENIFGRPV